MKKISVLLFALFTGTLYAAPLPEAGITQQQVQNLQGSPNNKLAAIGDPGISRWVYSDFTVYFEQQLLSGQQRVIHSVQH